MSCRNQAWVVFIGNLSSFSWKCHGCIYLTSLWHHPTCWRLGKEEPAPESGLLERQQTQRSRAPSALLYFHPQQGLILHSRVRPVHSSLSCSVLLPGHSRLAAEERNPVRFNAVLTGFRLHTSQTQGSLLGLLFPSLWLTVEPRPFLWEDNHLLLTGVPPQTGTLLQAKSFSLELSS